MDPAQQRNHPDITQNRDKLILVECEGLKDSRTEACLCISAQSELSPETVKRYGAYSKSVSSPSVREALGPCCGNAHFKEAWVFSLTGDSTLPDSPQWHDIAERISPSLRLPICKMG